MGFRKTAPIETMIIYMLSIMQKRETQKKQKTQNDKKLICQNNWQKIQSINQYFHSPIMRKI